MKMAQLFQLDNPTLSRLERAMILPPVAESIFAHCNTTDLLCIRNTSKTLRWFLNQNLRFFQNFVLLNKGAEFWEDELEKMNDNLENTFLYTNVKGMLRNTVTTVLNRVQEQRRIQQLADRRMVRDIIQSIDWSDPGMRPYWKPEYGSIETLDWEVPVEKPPKSDYFPKLMGYHLMRTLRSLPRFRNLTSLIIDGTGVDTEHMNMILDQYPRLRGISVRGCPNIDCSLWPDWILEQLHRHRPISLQWLRIWASGNVPTTYTSTEPLEGVTPLSPTSSDHASIYNIPDPATMPRYLFANVIPMWFHLSYTSRLVTPQHLHGAKKLQYEIAVQTCLAHQQHFKERSESRSPADASASGHKWTPPFYPLGDPNPITALLAVAKFLHIQLDIRFCANGANCFSYVNAKYNPPPPDLSDIPGAPPASSFIVMNLATGNAYKVPQTLPSGEQLLHTHSLSELGARRFNGGRECGKCGLWEDAPAPALFCKGTEIVEVAGVSTGPGIGEGRTTIGDVCGECVRGMTCQGCRKFLCPSCAFPDLTLPENPLMDQDHTDPEEVRWYCRNFTHGPFCTTCTTERLELFFNCDSCNTPPICLRCSPLPDPRALHLECPKCFRRVCGECGMDQMLYCWVCEGALVCVGCPVQREEEERGVVDVVGRLGVCEKVECMQVLVRRGGGGNTDGGGGNGWSVRDSGVEDMEWEGT
ncbi:hypothetical protein EX30DRAFT_368089 [Ascodesmis nigricans]|uniref:F-box domain-containing protein n=1 Tax=Ascodesmis nigricans TaxID=341454 RepID=A0A4S2N6L1_9PEZI|nr:hypothetical protein EX30DRAFT_368089 [Ascodesmis nigricans]